jgi:hypothetical protein
MLQKLLTAGQRVAMEPPFRLLARTAVKYLSSSVRAHALWDVSERPQYLVGILRAADEALKHGVPEIAVAEFGVAGGAGLLRMQDYAARVQAETGVRILVYGFDTGGGLPEGTGDYRDHPEIWSPGDFPMEWDKLRPLLDKRTELILGDVRDTIPNFVANTQSVPIGFIAIDVDFYSSTRDAFKILSLPGRKTLIRTIIYLDDVETLNYHRFAGELLAVDDFNAQNAGVKIDRWRGMRRSRPFPEHVWVDHMWVAYDLEAINRFNKDGRARAVLDLSNTHNL